MEQRLVNILQENSPLMDILRAVRAAKLPNWYVGAGVIRNTVWDHLHGYSTPTPARDIDVAFYDPDDLSAEREKEAELLLTSSLPGAAWEPINQARVHLWYGQGLGVQFPPLRSVEDAIDTWPEIAACIGIRLLEDETLKIYAPYGLDDLFNMILRRNPKSVTLERYRQRYIEKKIAERWPKVTFIDG